MGVFGAVFGCIGVVGFNGRCSGARSGDDGSMLACISGCRGVIGCKVATGGVLRAKKFALRGLMVGASSKKFALHAQNTQKSEFLRLLGEFFAETRLERLCWANFFAPIGPVLVLDIARRTSGWLRWGFCSIRSWLAVYRRRVAALMMQFPPFGGGEAVVQGGVAPKSQTTSVKNAGEGCGGRGGLRFGGIDRCRGVLFARHPPNMPLNLLLRAAQHVEASIA